MLDIDGTVILEDESLSPGVVDAVEHAHRAGHEVMIATGRSWEGTRGILRVLAIAPEFVVCSNGAVVLQARSRPTSCSTSASTSRRSTRPRCSTQLREHLPDARYLVELPDGRRLYTEYLEDWNLVHARARRRSTSSAAQPVCRIVVVAPEQGEQDFVDLVVAHRAQPGLVRGRLDGMARHRPAGRRQEHRARDSCAPSSASIPRTSS